MTEPVTPKSDIIGMAELLASIDREIAQGSKAERTQSNAGILFVVEQITKVTDTARSETVLRFDTYSENLIRSIAADELAVRLLHEIDITKLYCVKTGQPIGTLDKSMIGRAIDIHGIKKMEELSFMFLQSATAWHWQDTSPANLAELQTTDPYSFFVFAWSLILQQNPPQDYHDQLRAKAITYGAIGLAQKAALWQELHNKPIAEVIELNAVMQSVLAFIAPKELRKTRGMIPYPNLLSVCQPSLWRNLKVSIQNAVGERLKRFAPNVRNWTVERLQQMQMQIGGMPMMREMRAKEHESSGSYFAALMDSFGFQIHDGIHATAQTDRYRKEQAAAKRVSFESAAIRIDMRVPSTEIQMQTTAPQFAISFAPPKTTVAVSPVTLKKR